VIPWTFPIYWTFLWLSLGILNSSSEVISASSGTRTFLLDYDVDLEFDPLLRVLLQL
jgi:hypothetical protein